MITSIKTDQLTKTANLFNIFMNDSLKLLKRSQGTQLKLKHLMELITLLNI